MITWIYVAGAITPFVVLLGLMVGFKKPAAVAAPVSLLATLLIAWFIWEMETLWLMVAGFRGLMATLEIVLIILGAVLLLRVLEAVGAFKELSGVVARFAPDRRVQAILVAWFLVGFIEGVAGFGTPAMVMAPLLISIGWPAMTAVLVTLIGDSVAVTFGAVGVPMSVGIAQGVGGLAALESLGVTVSGVAIMTALIHSVLGLMIPFFIVLTTVLTTGGSWRAGIAFWPQALLAGICFLAPYLMAAVWLGVEFPSMIGGFLGLILFLILRSVLKIKEKESWIFPKDEGYVDLKEKIRIGKIIKAILPYTFLIAVLVLSRWPRAGFGDWLRKFEVGWESILGTGTGFVFQPLWSPGIFMIAAAGFALILYRLNREKIKTVLSLSFQQMLYPFLALLFVLVLTQVMVLSGNNQAGVDSMPMVLAKSLAATGWLWPLLAPVLGLFGSLVTGSSTVSNLLFAETQAQAALILNLPVVLMLALQGVGSAIGNMVALSNILAAMAVAGLSKGEEVFIIRFNLPLALVYVLAAGGVGLGLAFMM